MAQHCAICGKGLQRGRNVSHAHNRSHRVFKPNLQRVRAVVDGRPHSMHVCTKCIRSGRVEKRSHTGASAV
ncbi:MAG: 50S ribosomal protein L28 [Candidatus Latescibacteria bacterium]|nr:50S ribosomal protein L28 [Candidatus Latescibacterota bacterium]